MKKLLTSLVCFFFLLKVFGQQDARFSQFVWNNFLFNPAYAGINKVVSTGLYNKNSWLGFPGAPTSRAFTIHTPFNHFKNGIGLKLIDDYSNSYRNTNLALAYSYKINVAKGIFAFGIEGGFNYYSLNINNITIKDADDHVLAGNNSKTSPDISAGLFYKRNNLQIGFSARHLSQPRLSQTSVSNQDSRLKRTYYFTIRNDIRIGSSIILTPTLLAEYTDNVKPLIEAGAYCNFGQTFWTGVLVRTNEEISGQAGINIKKVIKNMKEDLRIGYAYDFGLSSLYKYNSGTHEIMLLYNFNMRPNPDKILRRNRNSNVL